MAAADVGRRGVVDTRGVHGGNSANRENIVSANETNLSENWSFFEKQIAASSPAGVADVTMLSSRLDWKLDGPIRDRRRRPCLLQLEAGRSQDYRHYPRDTVLLHDYRKHR